jgi:hypothetical protein
VVLALSALVALFALYITTERDRALSDALSVLQLVLALLAVAVAGLAQMSAARSPYPERSWILILSALALDAVWWAVVFGAGEVI